MANFKGTIYLTTRIFTEKNYGEIAVKNCLDALEPDERRLLEGITAVGWYPVTPILSFHRAVDKLYGRGDLALCEKIGEFSAAWNVNTVLKFFLRLKSPTWLMDKHHSVWNRFHDSGRWETSQLDTKVVIGKLMNFEVADEAFCARLRGWLQGAVRLTGGADAKTEETKCKARGNAYCEFKTSWR